MSRFTWPVSLWVLQGFFKVPAFGQGNQSKEINVLFLYPMFFFMDTTKPDLLFTNLLFLSLCTQEPQGSQIHPGTALMGDTAQAHLYPAPKFHSPKAFPRFLTSPTEETDKFSPPLLLLIPLPRWSSQELNHSLLYPLQTHNSIVHCYKGFKTFTIFSFFHMCRWYLWYV